MCFLGGEEPVPPVVVSLLIDSPPLPPGPRDTASDLPLVVNFMPFLLHWRLTEVGTWTVLPPKPPVYQGGTYLSKEAPPVKVSCKPRSWYRTVCRKTYGSRKVGREHLPRARTDGRRQHRYMFFEN